MSRIKIQKRTREIKTADQRYLATDAVIYNGTATFALHSAIEKTEANSERKPHYSCQNT